MKRFGIIFCSVVALLTVIFIAGTSFVKRASYLDKEYYRLSLSKIDSIRSVTDIIKDSVQAGFARVSITPSLNNSDDDYIEGRFVRVPLAGYGDRKGRPATGIHDSIFVKAAALKTGDKLMFFVSADLLIIPPNITDSVATVLAKKGIKRDQVVFSATHSHSSLGGWGPGYIGKQFSGDENKSLEKWLVLQISHAVVKAMENLQPARIGSGCFDAGAYTNNRLIGETGTTNNDFCFIVIEQSGGNKAIIGSFSAHATTLGSDNMEISSDYPGYWERKIEKTTADLAIFFAGSTGSQSPEGEGKGFEKAGFIGESLADSLNKHLPEVQLEYQIVFSYVPFKMLLPEYNIRLTNRIGLSSFISNRLMPEPTNVYLQVIRIGKMVWIATPSDFSGEYALQIKNALASKGLICNISSFNGSYIGYIIPGRYFFLDEYESKIMGWFGPEMGDYTVDLIRQITEIVTDTENL
jgi:hypothetical protein